MSDLTTSARSLIATARYRIGAGVSPSVEPFIDLAEKLAGELERHQALVTELYEWDADMTRGHLWTVLEHHGFEDGA